MRLKAVYDEKDDESPVPKLGCVKHLQNIVNLEELIASLFLFPRFLEREHADSNLVCS